MSAIAPYYGFRAGIHGLARYSSFAPRLGRVLYAAYRHRRRIGQIRQAVSVGNRLLKRKSAFKAALRSSKRRRIQGVGTSNTQSQFYQFGTSGSFDTLVRKTLGGFPLKLAVEPIAVDGLRQASQLRFFCSGIRICSTFRNVGNLPIHVHMAIVQPKEENANITGIRTDMFNDGVTSSVRYTNFTEASSDPSWSRNQDCAVLNKRKFNIFTHNRFQLNPNNTGTDVREKGSSYVHFEKYYKIAKWFEFETTSSSVPYKPLWILVWYETLFPDATTTAFLEYNINTKASIRKS